MTTRFFEGAGFGRAAGIGEFRPGYGFLWTAMYGKPKLDDWQVEEVSWNRWIPCEWWECACVCGKRLRLKKAIFEQDALAAGWHKSHEDDRGRTFDFWYCSVACDIDWALDRERRKPMRRVVWLRDCWGVNVWKFHRLTAENLPSGYGRA